VICPSGLFFDTRVKPLLKNISVFQNTNHLYTFPVPPRKRGISRSSRNAGWDAMDAGGASDEGAAGGRQSRVVLAPRRWCQVRGNFFAGDGGKKARFAGESTE